MSRRWQSKRWHKLQEMREPKPRNWHGCTEENWARFFESHRTAGETDGEDADDGIGGRGDQTWGAKRDRAARSGLRVAIT